MDNIMQNKKGQLTIFLIVGVVLLAGALIYIFATGDQQVQDIDAGVYVSQNVPQQVEPFKRYVEQCLQNTATEAVLQLGRNGGYVDPEDIQIDDTDPTNSDGISFLPDQPVPYWWQQRSKNGCSNCMYDSNNVPTIEEMQDGMDQYIEDAIDSCLGDFRVFEVETTNIDRAGEPEVETRITPRFVGARLTYPFMVTTGGDPVRVNDFRTTIDINVTRYYDLATKITQGQQQEFFLEKIILYLISSNAGPNKLPPFYFSEDARVGRTWTLPMTELLLKETLIAHLPLLKIHGVGNSDSMREALENDPELAATYGQFYQLLFDETYPDLEMRTHYLEWPMYLNIFPNEGGILREESVRHFSYPLGIAPANEIHTYQFFYDLAIPIVIELRDNDAFDGRGFSFFFGLEANIRDNHDPGEWFAGNGTIGPWNPAYVSVGESDEIEYAEEAVFPDLSSIAKTLICDEEQRLGAEVKLQFVDKFNGSALSGGDVSVRYSCGDYASCGTNLEREEDVYIAKLPVCLGGVMKIDKPGYRIEYVPIDSRPGQQVDQMVQLVKKQELILNLKKLQLNRIILNGDVDEGGYETTQSSGSYKNPNYATDKFVITITPANADPTQPTPAISANIDASMNEFPIEIWPGEFDVSIMYIYDDPVFIAPDRRTIDMPWPKDDEEYWMPNPPGIEYESYVRGGAQLNADTGYWRIRPNTLYSSDKVTMRAMEFELPIYLEDSNEMGEVPKYSGQFRNKLEPVLS